MTQTIQNAPTGIFAGSERDCDAGTQGWVQLSLAPGECEYFEPEPEDFDADPYAETAGDVVRRGREAQGYSLADFARRLGVGRNELQRWEEGSEAFPNYWYDKALDLLDEPFDSDPFDWRTPVESLEDALTIAWRNTARGLSYEEQLETFSALRAILVQAARPF